MDPAMNSAKEEQKKQQDEEKVKDSQETTSEQADADAHNPDTTGKSGDGETSVSTEDQLAFEKDRVLRLSAEFDNYKKRKQREIDDFKKFANESIFRQVLPVIDNLERAIDAGEQNTDNSSLLEGIQLTHKEIMKLLEMFNVKLVKAEKEFFDPNFHQAVTQQETDDFPENTVIKVLQKGYLLHDRLIRPAMVVVSKKKQTENTENKE